ncbi:peptidoglycan DD-metalloendopeptidase family protein [Hydrogenophaga aquatica]
MLKWGAAVVAVVLLGACAAPKRPAQRAPVVDRTGSAATTTAQPLPPGAENAGKPGYYTVRPGDTLMRIGLETGQAWRDIQAWNGIVNPNLIEVGQVLRVVPPQATASASVAAPAGPTTSAIGGSSVQGQPLGTPGSAAPSSSPGGAAQPPVAPSEELSFIWPASGPVIDAFDESRNKGVGIGGKAGDAVLAAADGRVVYAGAGLRGYGNLVILKHNNTYLTAYAHNQALLVREDQTVRKGQKIAEMGSSDADRVKLHFEVRRQGKPVDPLKHLPAR